MICYDLSDAFGTAGNEPRALGGDKARTPTGGVPLLKQMSLVLGCRHEPHLDFAEVFFGLERPCLRR